MQVDGEEATETSTRHYEGAEGTSASRDQGSVREAFRAKKREMRHKYKTLPSRFRGYEALLDTFDDPATNVPSSKLTVY